MLSLFFIHFRSFLILIADTPPPPYSPFAMDRLKPEGELKIFDRAKLELNISINQKMRNQKTKNLLKLTEKISKTNNLSFVYLIEV